MHINICLGEKKESGKAGLREGPAAPTVAPADLRLLCEKMQYEFFRAGDTVFEYGEVGAKFYIIL